MDHLRSLREESALFAECLDEDLDAPVRHCGTWTLRDLAGHMGRGNQWAAAAVTDLRGDEEGMPLPSDDALIRPWYIASAECLLEALARDPEDEAWTIFPPRTVGFWRRRRAQEMLIHRWDAQNALGRAVPLDPELAADGVAEVFDTMWPRQVSLGRSPEPAYALTAHASDAGLSWTYGPGEPVAEVTGTAGELLLMLWGRLPAGSPSLRWTGDRDAVLRGPITP